MRSDAKKTAAETTAVETTAAQTTATEPGRERAAAAWQRWLPNLLGRLQLAPQDLLRDRVYRRLWASILISSLGGQVTMLAIPLTAALLLQASPTQMGWLTTMELLPFLLLSLPTGVWLDRVRKLPVYVAGELALALGVASVPLAWWLGWLGLPWLYAVAALIGLVHTTAGSASQIVLTQVVPRERLVEAHARNALASSGAEVAGPGLAGALIRLLGAPLALLIDAVALVSSAAILRGLPVQEPSGARVAPGSFWADMLEGLRFVRSQPLLLAMAACVGLWQLSHQAATVVQILVATRLLGMSEHAVGLSYVALGVGTVASSMLGDRISQRLGPGPSLVAGFGLTSLGWLLLALAPVGPLGIAAFACMLACFGAGAILIFINFISLRQAVTPEPLLGRMTSVMRWLILLPAVPGALLGGWLGEHWGLRSALGFAGLSSLLLTLLAWQLPVIRGVHTLPKRAPALGLEALEEGTT